MIFVQDDDTCIRANTPSVVVLFLYGPKTARISFKNRCSKRCYALFVVQSAVTKLHGFNKNVRIRRCTTVC